MFHIPVLILSIIGFGFSYFIYSKKSKHEPLKCVIGGSCNSVVNSKFSEIFKVDNSVIGISYYIMLFFVSLALFFITTNALFILGLLVISGIAALASIILTGIQSFVIKEFCEYCTIPNLINIIIFLLIYY
jgi:uncharacterized membrane protein